jgi:hypothetical protein
MVVMLQIHLVMLELKNSCLDQMQVWRRVLEMELRLLRNHLISLLLAPPLKLRM